MGKVFQKNQVQGNVIEVAGESKSLLAGKTVPMKESAPVKGRFPEVKMYSKRPNGYFNSVIRRETVLSPRLSLDI